MLSPLAKKRKNTALKEIISLSPSTKLSHVKIDTSFDWLNVTVEEVGKVFLLG
jgi:hypothetical protein